MISDVLRQLVRPPAGTPSLQPGNDPCSAFPFDPESPWPKFRGNGLQTGRSPVPTGPADGGLTLRPWEFETGVGVFSSPVIDKDGTVYIGSADHYFYAIDRSGELKWRFATGELVDSSALLDDKGRVYFGSGDGNVYCLDKKTGQKIWTFAAHSTSQVEELFGIKTYNLNWFEGNVAMLGNGTLLVPNDNYLVYALDRDTGEPQTQYQANEMIWSCPAVNPATGRVFFTTCFNALVNIFCYDGETGKKIWTAGGLGSMSASPLLTSADPGGAVVVGGFDGILRALSQKTGKKVWTFGARDHIYGSPAQLSDGTVVLAACDGTVYGLNPENGKPLWTFDIPAPIRSSPAVDAKDRIYLGAGDGRLYCLNPDGGFRWAYTCIEGSRNDLNGSPALSPFGVVIAGENGGIFHVPYDWPLTRNGKADQRSVISADTGISQDGCRLCYVNPFGRLMPGLPETLDANQPVMLTHLVRQKGQTLLSAVDPKGMTVTVGGDIPMRVALSANKAFITLIPKETWAGPEGGTLDIEVRGQVKTRLRRFGLKFFGGKQTHSFGDRFQFTIPPCPEDAAGFPYRIPGKPGDPATVFEFSRLSCPHPTILPSYNQIGFDALHYLAVLVEGQKDGALAWVVPGRLDESTGKTVVDPGLSDVHVMEMAFQNGLVTFYNYHGFAISFVGSWDMPFSLYRIAGKADPLTGKIMGPAALNAVIRCDDIEFYGRFLKLTGMSDMKTGLMHICGAADLGLWKPDAGSGHIFSGLGPITLSAAPDRVSARFDNCTASAAGHVWGILLLDPESGTPVHVNYARKTARKADSKGQITALELDCAAVRLPEKVTVLVMKDTDMVMKETVEVKE